MNNKVDVTSVYSVHLTKPSVAYHHAACHIHCTPYCTFYCQNNDTIFQLNITHSYYSGLIRHCTSNWYLCYLMHGGLVHGIRRWLLKVFTEIAVTILISNDKSMIFNLRNCVTLPIVHLFAWMNNFVSWWTNTMPDLLSYRWPTKRPDDWWCSKVLQDFFNRSFLCVRKPNCTLIATNFHDSQPPCYQLLKLVTAQSFLFYSLKSFTTVYCNHVVTFI